MLNEGLRRVADETATYHREGRPHSANHDDRLRGPEWEMRTAEMSTNDSMKVRDFIGWQCDTCGQLITAIESGWVEWLASEDDHGEDVLSGVQIVHRGPRPRDGWDHTCRYDPRKEFRNNKSIVEGLPLERFVGPDGLMVLLSLFADGELPQAEVLELAKRVQIPGYELTRNLYRETLVPEVVTPLLGHGCYLQAEIGEMIAWALEKHRKDVTVLKRHR